MADDSENRRISARSRICIDFGTALSKASLCLDPTLPLDVGVRPIPLGLVTLAEHPLLTPSVLFVDGGRIFFGPAAFEYARRNIASDRDPLLSFKTVLGARDVDQALATQLPPSIDPTATFRTRDALVLYLAHLDQVLNEALSRMPELPSDVVNVRRRYTSPVWSAGSGVDRTFEQIFNEAASVSAKLSRLLLSNEGISIAQCRDALEKARTAPGDGKLDSGVFEPHAAAAAALAYSKTPIRFVCVFDMGAGTNDIAAFDFNETVEPPTLTEIKQARQCSALAGDQIDRILIDLIMRKRNAPDEERRVQRAMRLHARDLKRELFTTGRCGLKEGWRTTAIKITDLMEDANFKAFLTALHQTMGASLAAVAREAAAAGVNDIDIVLAGGGAHLPFMADLVRNAGAQAAPGMRLRIGALTPANVLYSNIDEYFIGVFPQIAMSVGGALVEMVDA